MATRKKAAANRSAKAVIEGGRSAARKVLQFRATQARRRARAVAEFEKRPARRRAPLPMPALPRRARALVGKAASAGVLIAEGDSWFDYPFHDVLQILEDDFLFDVESVAHKGDCVEDMAHSGGQFEEFSRRLEKLLRAGKVPRAILLSGGGNDIAGDEFPILLNHAASSLPPLNDDVVRGVIDVRLRAAYLHIVGGLTEIAQAILGRAIPIITHGYDYALPDGRGFMGGFWLLPGPWLEPGFRRKGYADFRSNAAVIVDLIDRFNAMLKGVSATLPHVHYLNLRNTLRHGSDFKKDWANELHPTEAGFRLVTAKFADLIGRV